MKYISSKDNPFYKQLSKVAQQKERTQALLEGYHLCQMYRLHGNATPKALILLEDHDYQTAYWEPLIKGIEDQRIFVLSPSLFKSLHQVDSPQPILYWIDIPTQNDFSMPKKTAVYLDRIQDPGNVGTILRTCAAVGIKTLYLSKGCVNPWSAKVLRSGQGAHFGLTIYTQVDSQSFLENNSLPLYLTRLDPNAQNLYQSNLPIELVWVFGNEGQGVDDLFLHYPHHAIFIPQTEAVESLNVGVACALSLYEHYRQHMV